MSTTDPAHDKTGAEGDASNDTGTPFTPRKDDETPVGDTDQHSKVPSDGQTAEEAAARKTGNAAND